ncbi:DNA internalization-related competence protein ComEC/Rec2 [Butyrivibrio sp. XPD2006]|uniref:DNA internalization-related competence protein ComEC/Rec2 n=1 Tax=Butyrivibrio sp. XPD2006 TaxID=1280668 RepID=UPI00040BAF16|nr:DNA internalization-related competence protein ComEC/Rec2 [Butyrivibrio sp. XPD2006]
MKRPLCLLAILLSAAVCIYLELFLSDIIGSGPSLDDGSFVTVVGRVSSKEFRRDFQGRILPVIYVVPTKQENKNSKLIQCYLESGDYGLPAIGQYVEISGKVRAFQAPTNPGEFDSRLYYSTLKISYRLTNASVIKTVGAPNLYREKLYEIRCFFERALDRSLSEQDSAIMKAMILGDKAFMDEETRDMYRNNGIMHILAVSGLHISLIGMGLYELLRKLHLGKAATTMIPIVFMYSYGIMCGMGTSSFRAICMFSLRLLAPVVGRTYDVLTALALAEILLLLDQPLYMYNSGFLFSFGAVAGMTLILPALDLESVFENLTIRKMKFADDEMSFAKEILLKAADGLKSGGSILLATLPVYAGFYYTYPLHSLFLNLLVIPVMGILMMLGIITMLLGSFGSIIAIIPGVAVRIILSLYRLLCSSESLIRGSTWYMGHSEKWQILVYMIIISAFVWLKGRAGYKRFILIPLAILILTFHINPEMEINMIDVGQGDGIVISSTGHHILIDGGSTSNKSVGKYSIIPFLKYKGIGKLDAVVVTHEDEDHISGILEIMDDMEKGGIRIKQLMLPEVSAASRGDNYHKLEQRAGDLGIPVSYINSGEVFNLGKISFTCLNPALGMTSEGANAYSTVLFMEYKAAGKRGANRPFTALFTGDVEGEGQDYLKSVIRSSPAKYADLSLLKVAHHGSRYTTDEEFLSLVSPKIAVISCGRDNSYGHPHQELLQRLRDANVQVFRTDEIGAISITVNNGKVVIK